MAAAAQGVEGPEIHAGHVDSHSHTVGYGTFAAVWLCLIMLTALTVAVSGLNLRALSVTVAVLVATVKSILVLWLFMHLKYESTTYKVFLIATLITFAIFLGLTFTDVGFRH